MRRQTIGLVIAFLTFTLGLAAAAMWIVYSQPAVAPFVASAGPAKMAVGPSGPQQNVKASAPTRPRYLKAIEILNSGDADALEETPTKFENLTADIISVELALGEDIENQFILLHADPAAPAAEFRIEQQFETSLTVMDEGPHVDLTEWQHYRSPWRAIREVEPHKFLTSKAPASEATRFPKVTREEISRAVREQVKGWDAEDQESAPRWARLARSCKSATEYPCGVSISKISFRIMVRSAGVWEPIQRIDFLVPMGC